MYCTNCGTTVPDHANYCPSCGTRIARPEPGQHATTAAIDLSGLDQSEHLEDLPDLSPGTGMFVVVRGPSAGARFLLDKDLVTIGRHPDADLFLDDVTVSRNHAEIHHTDDGLVLRDLGSLNGTYVSGSRVDEHHLTSGDEVQVGRFRLVYVGSDAQ